jgi:hypothetical protein
MISKREHVLATLFNTQGIPGAAAIRDEALPHE